MEEEDFDESMPQALLKTKSKVTLASTSLSGKQPIHSSRVKVTRATSVAHVRLRRRSQLATKLREVFDIPDITEVVAGAFTICQSHCLLGTPDRAFARTPMLAVTLSS